VFQDESQCTTIHSQEGDLMEDLLKQILAELKAIREAQINITTDFNEFNERFEDVITQLEDERRLDILRDYE
jgi:hypothetical protein